jgi:hypothetical protein
MQHEPIRRRRRPKTENPDALVSADTFYTTVPKPIGSTIREMARVQRRSHSAVIRDFLVEKLGEESPA